MHYTFFSENATKKPYNLQGINKQNIKCMEAFKFVSPIMNQYEVLEKTKG